MMQWQLQWQRERIAQLKKEADAQASDPLGRHRWVLLEGLQTAELNGRYAEVLVPPNEADRFGVRVLGEGSKKLIKRANLSPIPDAKTQRVCRLAAKGEGGRPWMVQNTRWPRAVLDALPYQVSPVSTRLGFPLRVARVHPHSELGGGQPSDNQWATWMMIEATSGFAPPAWQCGVGPVVVWRPDAPVSAEDMYLFHEFLTEILHRYSDGHVRPDRDLTPESWARERERLLDDQRLNPHLQQYEDLHI